MDTTPVVPHFLTDERGDDRKPRRRLIRRREQSAPYVLDGRPDDPAGDHQTETNRVVRHLPLARVIVGKLAVRYHAAYEREDALQDACIGLIHALRRYDAGRGIPFATFAGHRMQGAVFDGMRRVAKLSRRDREAGRVEPALVPLDAPIGASDEDGQTVGALIPDTAAPDPADAAVRAEAFAALRTAVGLLPERERRVLFLYDVERLSFEAIAGVLGCSRSRVGQLRRAALRRLAGELQGMA